MSNIMKNILSEAAALSRDLMAEKMFFLQSGNSVEYPALYDHPVNKKVKIKKIL